MSFVKTLRLLVISVAFVIVFVNWSVDLLVSVS